MPMTVIRLPAVLRRYSWIVMKKPPVGQIFNDTSILQISRSRNKNPARQEKILATARKMKKGPSRREGP